LISLIYLLYFVCVTLFISRNRN